MKETLMTSDLNIRPELLGLQTMISPFPQFTSSQRLMMLASHSGQMVNIHGAEVPKISSGYEPKFGKYEFETSSREQDMQIIQIIPKFRVNDTIKSNPSLTVVYRGADDGLIHCIDIDSYTALYKGFGYENKMLNKHLLMPNNFVSKDIKFTTSPNHDENGLYRMGVNANVVYMPASAVCDDAFVISDRLQKKLEHTAIVSAEFDVRPDMVPLNLYGNLEIYKSFPDIGDTVRDDGNLISFRPVSKDTFITDITGEELMIPERFHDESICVDNVSAEVIDVQVFMSNRVYQKFSEDQGPYQQFMKYQKQHYQYYDDIVKLYNNLVREGYKMGDTFNDKVMRAFGFGDNKIGRSIIPKDKREVIGFIHVKITYKYTRVVNKGFKITGDAGDKGVISDIWNIDRMPIDEFGNRADIIITGESGFNRLNPSQFYKQFINFASEILVGRIRSGEIPRNQAYEFILDFMNEVRPNYATLVRMQTKDHQQEYVDDVLEKGIHWTITPFCKTIGIDMVRRIMKKYKLKKSHIKYKKMINNNLTELTTKYKGIISSKYLYLLSKTPEGSINAVEYGYVSQFNTPIKPGSKEIKYQSNIGQTPIKDGEDETGMKTMSVGPEVVARLLSVYANSQPAIDKLQNMLLTADKPTDIEEIPMTYEQIILSNNNIAIFNHMFAVAGARIEQFDGRKYA